jgi:hypothetical protein
VKNCIVPQDGASGLWPHAHRATLQGTPRSLAFPPCCPNCGQAATHKIAYAKVFRRSDGESPTAYIVSEAQVPFCDACIAQHRAQEQPPDWKSTLLTLFADAEIFGAIFPGLGALFLLNLALRDLWHARFTSMAIELGLGLFFAWIARLQAGVVRDRSAHLRVPPLSEVTQAFDFSDDVSGLFEPSRVMYTMRDARFAAAFAALNRDREWDANGPQAKIAGRKATLALWTFGALLLTFALWDWFYG